ncbi:hypothetical protein GTU73_08865 [Rathayibacter sp. VKM Ac-2804]|uniref:hypothetical protein n=1 Tax=Rathayibacter sp. VKM Ac-2804 TaxID=2609257 RepID=UPI00132EA9D5|nr:hypothetical protein [Rathayibacter sp. VKM Ac-2804]QHF24110.1 hypothetical protein GTU73_08865 [Rathayibacter sp. VKM Ac-2804]
MSAELVITQHKHVQRAGAKAIVDYIADVAGLSLSVRPLVQLADQPIEIETMSGGLAIMHATLVVELDDEQVATIKRLAEIEPDPEG